MADATLYSPHDAWAREGDVDWAGGRDVFRDTIPDIDPDAEEDPDD